MAGLVYQASASSQSLHLKSPEDMPTESPSFCLLTLCQQGSCQEASLTHLAEETVCTYMLYEHIHVCIHHNLYSHISLTVSIVYLMFKVYLFDVLIYTCEIAHRN